MNLFDSIKPHDVLSTSLNQVLFLIPNSANHRIKMDENRDTAAIGEVSKALIIVVYLMIKIL